MPAALWLVLRAGYLLARTARCGLALLHRRAYVPPHRFRRNDSRRRMYSPKQVDSTPMGSLECLAFRQGRPPSGRAAPDQMLAPCQPRPSPLASCFVIVRSRGPESLAR